MTVLRVQIVALARSLRGVAWAALLSLATAQSGSLTATAQPLVSPAEARLAAKTAPTISPLAEAARVGDVEAVQRLLPQTDDPNAPGEGGTPALHWAIERSDAGIARALLAAGADPNLATRYGVRPLALAAANGDADMIRLLVDAGGDVDATNAIGETILMAAAESGDVAAVQTLLDLGAAVDARDAYYGQTALMIAARQGNKALAAALLDAGANPDASTRVGAEPDWILPNSRPGFSFGIGIIRGGLPADRGMRPFRPGGMTPLLFAARTGDAAMADLLLDRGADIEQAEANDIRPLLMAVSNESVDVAVRLAERGAALDEQDWYGRSALWSAVNVRNLYVHNQTFEHTVDRDAMLELITLLLERGADPNLRTTESPPVRDHLLGITGTLEWVDFTGQTPFLAAALAGDTTVMRLLLDHGADPHIPTFGGTTALMAAAGVNWVVSQTYTEGPDALLEAVRMCIDLGMDVDAANSMGIRAIHGAANRGSNDIIELLASHGADLTAADNEGRTPLDWARGVFLATHPAEPKPESIALLEQLLAER